jgi:hypothetical protein
MCRDLPALTRRCEARDATLLERIAIGDVFGCRAKRAPDGVKAYEYAVPAKSAISNPRDSIVRDSRPITPADLVYVL